MTNNKSWNFIPTGLQVSQRRVEEILNKQVDLLVIRLFVDTEEIWPKTLPKRRMAYGVRTAQANGKPPKGGGFCRDSNTILRHLLASPYCGKEHVYKDMRGTGSQDILGRILPFENVDTWKQ